MEPGEGKKRRDPKKQKKEDVERELKEERKKLDLQFIKLREEEKFDPYEGKELDRGDGKIQVEAEDERSGEKKIAKFRYLIQKRPQQIGEFKKYFKEYDWKAKGVVRKRFDTIKRQSLLVHGFSLNDLRDRLHAVKDSLKALEEVTGKIPQLKQLLGAQQTKFNFLAKPRQYYKEFFQVMNGDG